MSSALWCQAADGVLTISFREAKILDAIVIEQMHRDLIKIVGESGEPNVLLEFGCVQFMSSAALGMLIRIQKRCKELKKGLKLCGLAPNIHQVFRVTSLDRVFELHGTAEQARAAFAAGVEA